MKFLTQILAKAGIIAPHFQADTANPSTGAVGRFVWNDADGTMNLGLKGGNVTLQVGQEQVARVVNKTGVNLLASNYQAVKISGAQGQRLAVDFAQANNDLNSADTIGLVTENITNNQEGFVTTFGRIEEINTTGSIYGETWADGDVLYLSGTTPGAITNVKPSAPIHIVVLGYVEYAHQNHGKIFVKVMNGWELDELHDVAPKPYVNKGVLYRDTATNLWKSATVDTLLGYTPLTTTRQLTINGTTYDLSADRTWNVGTVTNVSALTIGTSGTDLSSTVLNSTTTPVITLNVPTASATNRGVLSPSDWSTFNSKQDAISLTTTGSSGASTFISNVLNIPTYTLSGLGGVASSRTLTINGVSYDLSADRTWNVGTITGSGTINYIPKFTSSTAIGDSLVYDNGTSVAIGTISPDSSNKFQVEGRIAANVSTTSGSSSIYAIVGSSTATYSAGTTLSGGVVTNGVQGGMQYNFGGNATIPNSVPTGSIIAVSGVQFNGTGTVTVNQAGSGVRSLSNIFAMWTRTGDTSGTVTHMSNLRLVAPYSGSSGTLSVTNYYGIIIENSSQFAPISITNKWGIYQEGSGDNNYFAGKLLVNKTTDDGYQVDVAGQIRSDTRVVAGLGGFTNNCLYTYISNHCGSSGYIGFGFSNTTTPSASDSIFDIYQGNVAAPIANLFNFKHSLLNAAYSQPQAILGITTTINQSGTATGDIRGIYYNPSVTSIIGNHYAWESTSGKFKISDLAGTGTRMVVADSSGVLSTQSIPSGASIGATITGGTTGSVLFIGASSVLAQDNANLFWDDTTNRLGIGTNTPGNKLTIEETTNVAIGFEVKNTSTGNVNSLNMNLTADSTAGYVQFQKRSSTHAATGIANASSGLLYNSAGDLIIGTGGATSWIRFATNGIAAADMNLTANGRLLLGTSTEGTFLLDVNGTSRVTSTLTIGTTGASFNIAYVTGGSGNINLGGSIGATPDRSLAVAGTASGTLSTAVGLSTTASNGGTAIGGYITVAAGGVSIGCGVGAAVSSGTQTVAIGNGATAYSANKGTAINGNIGVSGSNSTGIAINGTVLGGYTNGSIALMGYAAANQSIAIYGTTTSQNELVIGSSFANGDMTNYAITQIYFGSGKIRGTQSNTNTTGAGISYTINGSGAFGTDFAGGNITIAGGKGTGTGASGDIIFSTASTTTTGTTLQTLTNRWWIKGTSGILSNVSSPDASAILQADSTTRGFLPPRMTTTQKNAITTPAAGLVVYDTTTNKLCCYNGTTWNDLF